MASEKFEYRFTFDLGSYFHLRALEVSPQPNGMVHAAQVRSYIFWIDWPGNSPETSRLRTLGRAIGSGASTRLASETCCCSLLGRTNRLVALSSKPVLHRRRDDSCSSSRLALRPFPTPPIAPTFRPSPVPS